MLFGETADKLTHPRNLHRVKTDRRLVEDNNLRVSEKRLCHADTLPVTFTEVLDQLSLHVIHAGKSHYAVHLGLAFLSRNVAQFRHEIQVLAHPHIRINRRNLGKVADALLCLLRLFEHVVPFNENIALGRGDVSGDHVHCGGFAGAVRAEKSEDLAVFNGK